MPRDASGNYVRPTNSFSNPVTLTVINSTDADSLFDDFESAMNMSSIKTPNYLLSSANIGLPNSQVLAAGAGLISTATASGMTISVGAGTGITVNADDVQLSTINPRNILANPSASTAAPVGTAFGIFLDGYFGGSPAQGTIIYRDTGGPNIGSWFGLPPATAGNVLTTQGASANPTWSPATPSLNPGQVLGNASGATANAVGTAVSAMIDASIGSANVQGSILYRGASAWLALAPATAGNFLRTGGTGADPNWAAIAGGGDMLAANNLSDLTNISSAQVNLGVNGRSISGGRLTLTAATPVQVATLASASAVWFVPHIHDKITIYDGTHFKATTFVSASQNTNDSTKSPAAVTSNSNYDIFAWNDAGTIRATRGPAWTSSTARGTGAGTTELVRVNGVFLNANNITNGPNAQRGTYLGTIRTNGTNTVDFIFGTTAAGGGAASFGVWNYYNRVSYSTRVSDSTDSWTIATASWRSANQSDTMRCSFIIGLNEDAVRSTYVGIGNAPVNPLGTAIATGVCLDNNNTFSGTTGNSSVSNVQSVPSLYVGNPGLGFHFLQATEFVAVATAATWYGDAGVLYVQNGLIVDLRL